mgnify:CR=1 FL=1
MKIINDVILRYIRIIVIIILVFYIGTIIGYVALGKGSFVDALTLKSIRHIKHIKDIIYN